MFLFLIDFRLIMNDLFGKKWWLAVVQKSFLSEPSLTIGIIQETGQFVLLVFEENLKQ